MWTKLCAAFVLYTMAGCAGLPRASVLADGSYPMKPNDSVAIGGGASVRYDAFADSRCPNNAQCIWAGKVSYRFTVTGGAGQEAFALDYEGQQVVSAALPGVRFGVSFKAVGTLPVEQHAVVLEVRAPR